MSVKVAVRVRPFNSREKNLGCTCIVDMSDPKTILKAFQGQQEKPFTFDYSFWSFDQFQQDPSNGYLKPTGSKYADQKIVYDKIGNKILDNAFQGYHCCLFAYGQTGSGKSYSMIGYGSNKGIVPIICDEIFQRITKNKNAQTQCEVYCSMIQIYNQEIQDLTIPISKRVKGGLKVRQNKLFGVYVQGVKKNFVKSYQEIQDVMEEGTKNRTVAATQMNATSSRAHTVITIQFKQITKQGEAKSEKVSLINLVDLAGSQRQDKTGASGQRLKQAVGINLSLTNLGQVISTLADNAQGAKKFVPYRNSALTRILQNALGGNSQTVMICAISPANDNYEETLSTLRYADRAKKIQNKPVVNETAQDKLIRQLKEENQRLKKVLEKQGKDPNIKITEENKKPDQNNEKWQQQLKKFDQQRKKLQEQKKKLQEQKLKLEQEKNQQDQQNKMLEQSNKRLEENLKNLEFNNKKMEESYRLQDEINKKQNEERFNKLQEQSQKLLQDKNKLQDQRKKIEQQKKKIEQDKNQSQEQNKKLEQSNKKLAENLKNLEFNNKKLEETYRKQDELNKKQHEDKIKRMQEQGQRLSQDKKMLQEQKKKLQEQKKKLEQEKNQQDQQNNMLQQNNKKLAEILKNLEFNNKKLEETYRKQDEINKKQQEEKNKMLQEQSQRLSQDKKKLQEQKKKLQEQKKKLEQEKNQSQEQRKKLEEINKKLEDNNKKLQKNSKKMDQNTEKQQKMKQKQQKQIEKKQIKQNKQKKKIEEDDQEEDQEQQQQQSSCQSEEEEEQEQESSSSSEQSEQSDGLDDSQKQLDNDQLYQKLQADMKQLQILLQQQQLSKKEKQLQAQKQRRLREEQQKQMQDGIARIFRDKTFQQMEKKGEIPPYFENISRDFTIHRKLRILLQKDRMTVGKLGANPPNDIVFGGRDMKMNHAILQKVDRKVFLRPINQFSHLYVNGKQVTKPIELMHLDRVIFGWNSVYLFKNKDDKRMDETIKDKAITWQFCKREASQYVDIDQSDDQRDAGSGCCEIY